MDSTQLERETLESKDRDALVTMATALGGKPGSRARKAEIVDLILEMTAGTKGSSNGSQVKKRVCIIWAMHFLYKSYVY